MSPLAKSLPESSCRKYRRSVMSSDYVAVVLSRTIRVVLLSSRSATSLRERRKSLNDLNPSDFSENDGSIRFIWALTAELCSQSASSFSWPMRRARSSRPVAAACGSGCSRSSSGSGGLARRVVAGLLRLGALGGLLRPRGRGDRGYTGQCVVGDEVVAGGRERSADRTGDADADDVAAEALTALRERDVVRIAGDDDPVGQVGQPEHVLDRVDREPDVGAVLGVGGRGKELNEVDRPAHQLTPVVGVDVR